MQRVEGSVRRKIALFWGYFVIFTGLLFAAIDLQKWEGVFWKMTSSQATNTYREIHEELADDNHSVLPAYSSAPIPSSVEDIITQPSEPIREEKEIKKLITILPDTLPKTVELGTLVRDIGESRYFKDLLPPLTVELTRDRVEPRGRMTPWLLSIVTPLSSESEFIKVLTHEMGHSIDVEHFAMKAFSADVSAEFYALSWLDTTIKRKWQALGSFASGYAMTSKYEDFAEAFTFFIFHNEEFVRRAAKDPILAQKYDFLLQKVFTNAEFVGTSFEIAPVESYVWDTTKIAIFTANYLRYIR
jgi:hypothetical protein